MCFSPPLPLLLLPSMRYSQPRTFHRWRITLVAPEVLIEPRPDLSEAYENIVQPTETTSSSRNAKKCVLKGGPRKPISRLGRNYDRLDYLFPTNLTCLISSPLPYYPPSQDESISMNIKLRNLRSAEEDLGKFLGNVVVSSELATSICGDEVNDAYLEYVIELNNKVSSALTCHRKIESRCTLR